MFQEDVAGAETIRSKLATVCWISFVVFIKIDCIHCSHLKSNSWDFTHVCDYSIIRCYSSSAVNVINSWRWNLCGVWSYCHLVFQKVTDSQIKSILFSGLVSVQSTWLEVCFLTTAIFFPFFIFVLIQIVVQHPYIYGIWVNNTILLYSISSKITALPVLSHRI